MITKGNERKKKKPVVAAVDLGQVIPPLNIGQAEVREVKVPRRVIREVAEMFYSDGTSEKHDRTFNPNN